MVTNLKGDDSRVPSSTAHDGGCGRVGDLTRGGTYIILPGHAVKPGDYSVKERGR